MFEKLNQVRRNNRERIDLTRLLEACRKLLSERGEANSAAIAEAALKHYAGLSPEAVHRFFEVLALEYDPDPGELLMLAEKYAVNRSPEHLVALSRAAEPPRQELMRRMIRAPGGAAAVVQMRASLLGLLRKDKRLTAVDADLEHLLGSWFNPGFLNLVQVDWQSPAGLLEKIILHEAVHEIDGWNDLRRRLRPDRRCFAFFHPTLPDEPLIFVEVALLSDMPSAIAPLIDREGPVNEDVRRFRVAAFYSISNCQPGLKGVNLGNFLIKRVAERLKAEFPNLKTFCTLSPIPTFADWVQKTEAIKDERLKVSQQERLNRVLTDVKLKLSQEGVGLSTNSKGAEKALQSGLESLGAYYLYQTSAAEQRRSDPVARFHLNNGARLERINLQADLSKKGLKQSHGLMVNYLYDLDEIENNHQSFVHEEVSTSSGVLKLL